MKKLLVIVVLCLLWCNVSFAEDLKIVCKITKSMNEPVNVERYDYLLVVENNSIVTTSFIRDKIVKSKNVKNTINICLLYTSPSPRD